MSIVQCIKQFMKNLRQQSKQEIQAKEQQLSTGQKIVQFITRLFLWEKNVQRSISIYLVSNTYFQLLEITYILLLLSYFAMTNNETYHIIMSVTSGVFFLIYFVPRLSRKHIVLQIVLIVYAILTICFVLFQLILIKNYNIFIFYCSQIRNYYLKKSIETYPSQNLCQQITNLYQLELIVETVIGVLRLVYMGLIFAAYRAAREKHEAQQKKRRRKQKYDQLLLKRLTYNEKRKV